ncbi:hypothetical protein Q1695_016352 [Nippostrongylus brasiliensis]|nr:hypothetical protein Q1695_016352 [Nippostrongylus brasiliensis]
MASPDAFSASLRVPSDATYLDLPLFESVRREEHSLNRHNCEDYTCLCEPWTDQSSVELIVTSTNILTMSSHSDHMSKMNDNVDANFLSDADLQFDVNWPYSNNALGNSESPPYSRDIYAVCSPNDGGYAVDLNDIDAAFDCDISALDAYLHSGTTTTTNMTPTADSNHTSSRTAQTPSAVQRPEATPHSPTPTGTAREYCSPPSCSTDPVEEFFPDLCDSSSASNTRCRNASSGTTRSSVSRYSPYSVESTTDQRSESVSEYRMRRDKNNLASQRSRQKKAEKMREMRAEREVLERRNIELKALLASLENQVADYKNMVLMVVSKSHV